MVTLGTGIPRIPDQPFEQSVSSYIVYSLNEIIVHLTNISSNFPSYNGMDPHPRTDT